MLNEHDDMTTQGNVSRIRHVRLYFGTLKFSQWCDLRGWELLLGEATKRSGRVHQGTSGTRRSLYFRVTKC